MTHECSRLVFRNSHFEFFWNLNFIIWDFKRYHHKILRGYYSNLSEIVGQIVNLSEPGICYMI